AGPGSRGVVAGGGGAGLEIPVAAEGLSDQQRADRLAVPLDQAALGLLAEERLPEQPESQRIQDAAKDHRQHEQPQVGTQVCEHECTSESAPSPLAVSRPEGLCRNRLSLHGRCGRETVNPGGDYPSPRRVRITSISLMPTKGTM